MLRQGTDEIRSNYISYNSTTGIFRAEGRPDAPGVDEGPGAKVRGTFQPRSDSPVSGSKGDAKDKDKATGDKSAATKGKAPARADTATKAPVTLKPADEPSKP